MDPEGVNKFLRIVRFLIKKNLKSILLRHIFFIFYFGPPSRYPWGPLGEK